MSKVKIAILPGSARKDSCNVKLGTAISMAFQSKGIETTLISMRDYPMPIYDGDLEEKDGIPESVNNLSSVLCQHQGIVLVSPEYNSSISPLLKNTLDWMSRGGVAQSPYKNRVFALSSCSPGGLGGIRGLMHLRDTLLNSGVEIITPQLCVGGANGAFDDSGNLTDSRHQALLESLCNTLIKQATYCLKEQDAQ